MHHLIKFGYKKLSSLEDIVFTKFHDHTDMGQCGHEILSLKKKRGDSHLHPPPPTPKYVKWKYWGQVILPHQVSDFFLNLLEG